MMKNKFDLRKVLMLAFCLLVITTSALGQRRKCPLEKYNGNWAFGTTTSFHVGDPFDGIGQVEVMRPGKPAQIHEKNRKWTLDGVKIKPGEVFTKAGKFIMTIESNGFKTAYHVEILPAVEAKKPVATVVAYPKQTEYKVGDRFYIDGIKVECHDANGRKLPVESKDITFFTSVSNTLVGTGYQCGGGYKFSIPGRKVIEVRYKSVTIGKYTINVVEGKQPTTQPSSASTTTSVAKAPANGWYNLRAMYNYLNFDATGYGELRKKSVNTKFYVERKGDKQVTLKMANGKYLGIDSSIKDGARVKAINSPYLWTIYSENNADIYSLRPSTDTRMVVNASGEKSSDGTHIILWTHTDYNAPNNAEFRFIPVR
ncbi:hypothetical protein [Bacteroides sedimenti]|uniref:Ricin B lectin domain-containing protein n=1 Tax=Bacteroides sedimenti TaxID=2136147 RepID=A0ABN6YZT7_9BACE